MVQFLSKKILLDYCNFCWVFRKFPFFLYLCVCVCVCVCVSYSTTSGFLQISYDFTASLSTPDNNLCPFL